MKRNIVTKLIGALAALSVWTYPVPAGESTPEDGDARPLPRIEVSATTIDMDVGKTVTATLTDGSEVRVTAVDVNEERDPIRRVLRRAEVTIEVNDKPVTLTAGLYNLPVAVAGVRVDCPVTQGYMVRSSADRWGIDQDVRLRFWPAAGPLTEFGTFRYPIRQRLFASSTFFDNEPVDGGDEISERIYYHSGVDFGAMEGVTEVLAAADARVVSARGETLAEFEQDSPIEPRGDVLYLLDGRGWFYRYSHFHTIFETVHLGDVVSIGTPLGVVGKEGASGGWSHLHFEILARQPSGKWGAFAAYALLREAYIREYQPEILAKARQRYLLRPGDSAVFDGSGSWSADAAIVSYTWRFTNDETATGPVVSRVYEQPGLYNEILKVTDAAGRVDYDFAIVQVIDPAANNRYAPSLHAVCEPTFGIRPGDPVTFAVRAFRCEDGKEVWDMGDGSEVRHTQSSPSTHPHAPDGYARLEHRYDAPGDYIVRVSRVSGGVPAATHLHVRVESRPSE
ncbi:MAG TPA: PKD domain-containing protein [Candidatus Hydrogenedentes bacterium]|nr:PKD domain-containing protein [Candidatus Hydrogenedentota bacterium]HPG65570.1 PKD domain-containing protein [Candidatus Hydrogenedentota bacterium]